MSKEHVLTYLEKGLRMDGRKKDAARKVTVEYGTSKSAEGSATVTMGKTKVIAGVKMAMSKPYPDRPDEGGLMVNAELLPLSSPKYEPGPPSIKSIELARVVDRGIRESKAIDSKKLCIEKGEKAWFVSVDVCSLNDDGNLLEACSLAAIAAIKDAKFPEYDAKTGVVNFKKLTKKGLPVNKEPEIQDEKQYDVREKYLGRTPIMTIDRKIRDRPQKRRREKVIRMGRYINENVESPCKRLPYRLAEQDPKESKCERKNDQAVRHIIKHVHILGNEIG